MTFIEQAIELAASPTNRNNQVRIERSGDGGNATERHVVDPTTLDPRDHVAAFARSSCQVCLSPSTIMAESPNSPSDPRAIHRSSVT